MYAGQIMHRKLITVSPGTSLEDAKILIRKNRIDHLLIVNEAGRLIGILSDRDVREYCASPATSLSVHELNYLLQQIVVETVMKKKVITITSETPTEHAAFIMQENDINALPVVDDDKLVGIVTSTDVMGVLLRAIGLSETSIRLGVMVKDGIGAIADVCTVLKKAMINIESLLSWPDEEHPGVAQLIIRINRADMETAMKALQDAGFPALNHYVADITPYLPA